MRGVSSISLPILVAGAAALLGGCTGSGEDPRVSLCRNLAGDLSGVAANQWSSDGNRFVRPEYAEVKVAAGPEKAACFYQYETLEESALDHANPLLAYATLPYRMTLNGVDVAGPTLAAAVMVQQKEAPERVLKEARKTVEQASEQVRRTLDKVNSQ